MKCINAKNFTLACALLTTLSVGAQSMRTIPNFSQLPGPVVHKILQDEEGYIWYGTTESAICRDNGYQVDVFMGDEKKGFSRIDRFINEMCLTRDHKILFGTPGGAWVLDKRTYQIDRLDTIYTPGHNVRYILADKADNTYWLTIGATVLHLEQNGRLIRLFNITYNDKEQSGLSLFQDSKDRLWLMLHQGDLRLYNRTKDTFERCRWDYPSPPLYMVEDQQHGCFWIGTTHGGIVSYRIGSNPLQGRLTSFPITRGATAAEAEKRGFVFGICQSGNLLWASAMDDLYCYAIGDDAGSLTEVNTSDFMPQRHKVLDCPILDRRGNIWVPSYTPNPFVISPFTTGLRRYAISQMEQQTGYPLIADLIEQEGDGLWLMQSHVGLMYYSTADNKVISEPDGAPSRFVNENLMRHKGGRGVWVKNQNHLYHSWMEDGRIRTEWVGDYDRYIRSYFETRDGHLLIGTNDGLYRYDIRRRRSERLVKGTGVVTDICQTDDGALYLVSHNNGFARLTATNKLTSYDRNHNFDHLATDGHRVWLSSPDGLVASFDAATQQVSIEELACDKRGAIFKHMTVDSNGHVWLATSLYIKEYNPRNHSFRIYNTDDSNVRVDYFQDVKADGQQICIGAAGALFHTTSSTELEDSVQQALPVLTDIAIDGQRQHLVYGVKKADISADVSQVLVYLSTFDHLNAANTMFAYRLVEKGNEKWIYLPMGTNTIQLSNLAKGNYTLEVKATNEAGNWSEAHEVFTICRLPAWWETWWAYLLWLLLGGMALFAVVSWYIARQRQKHQAEMDQQLTDMKIRFFINISHELRTPLALIITPLSSIVSNMYEGELKRKLITILRHANDLLQQVNNLLSFRKLEMGKMTLQLRFGELNDFTEQECDQFRPLFDKKQVKLLFTPSPTALNFYFDKNIVHHILFNLLSNAHKFTPTGGEVHVSIHKQTDGMIRIDVADNGQGISEEQQKHIFERFYQGGADSTQEGSGIGLNMVSEMVAIHRGSVSVKSQLGIGSTFSIFLPWGWKDKKEANDGKTTTDDGQQQSLPAAPATTADTTERHYEAASDAPLTILVVEDNDEFRQFLTDELSPRYHVLQAADGEEGLAVAQEEQVDVVISDVMMPKKDGFEMCYELKHNDKTSYLTVILLTARAGQESELVGYQCGADYYVTKPFDMEILLNRLQFIERQQQERRQLLLQQIENPDIDTLYKAEQDREFVKRIMELLKQHLADPEYKPESLSSDLCISYITAYRKIKALTGLTPGEFIRNFRLKHACQLLRSTTKPLADIAEQVGFSSASYFTRCFMKDYNISPSQYRQEAQE